MRRGQSSLAGTGNEELIFSSPDEFIRFSLFYSGETSERERERARGECGKVISAWRKRECVSDY